MKACGRRCGHFDSARTNWEGTGNINPATFRRECGIDGGITPETATACHQAGANVFVAGTAVFRAPDPVAAIGQIKRLA